MAFKVINDSIGPNSLIPTLLIFRAYLYIVKSNIPNPIIIKQIAALKKAIKEVKKLKTER
jgi:methyltransferase-like protein